MCLVGVIVLVGEWVLFCVWVSCVVLSYEGLRSVGCRESSRRGRWWLSFVFCCLVVG